ncbi:hypothetical protein Sjap_011278 [Stephania japonica]|uniref:Uncharacterized protein n=1 Tax=Stephania japonica TaxID=461633 RepID=A0AAP0JB27_9MAGN
MKTLFGVIHGYQAVWLSNATANDCHDIGKCQDSFMIMWVSPNPQSCLDNSGSGEELYDFTCHVDFEFSFECMMDSRLGEAASGFPMPWWLFLDVEKHKRDAVEVFVVVVN